MPTKKNFEFIHPNDTVIIALSGGPDSMCLLSLLIEIKQEKNINIIVAYINHQARATSNKEEQFVTDYCKKQNILLKKHTINNYSKGKFSEEEARNIRYDFFASLGHLYHANYILTAHHADDLTETILMKIIRGSTLKSIIGIKKYSTYEQIPIIRPLLNVSKEDIYNYLKLHQIPYIIDETNKEDKHLRNRIRNHLLPILKKEDKNIHLKFLKFSEELEELLTYLEQNLEQITKEIKTNNKTNLTKFLELNNFLQKEYLKKELKQYYNKEITKINQSIINNCLTFLHKENKTTYELPNNTLLIKNQQQFYLIKKEKNNSYCIKCEEKTIIPNKGTLIKLTNSSEKSNNIIYLNSKDIKLPLYITTRKPGMKMNVKNLQGHKKIKDILIDEKIPLYQRNDIPIMIDSNNTILWILGIKKSQLDKPKNYDIIYKYEKE